MAFSDHMTEFAGLPVVEYRSAEAFEGLPPEGSEADPEARQRRTGTFDRSLLPGPSPELDAALKAPGSVAWRLAAPEDVEGDGADSSLGYYRRFTESVDQDQVTAIVVGDVADAFATEENSVLEEALREVAPRLTGLRSLFYADIVLEETEVSWIEHGDLAPLLSALPGLTEFAVRGTGELSLHVPRHGSLRRLTLQGGGLPGELTREVVSSGYPELEHLELWLGVEEYGGDTAPEDLAPVLSGAAFPGLRSLGLRNAEHTGAWVRTLAESPVTARLRTLDLSLGTLRDEDVAPLLESPVFRGLRRLDLHHHYLSEEAENEVRTVLTGAGVEVDLSDRQEPNTYGGVHHYYTAVAE